MTEIIIELVYGQAPSRLPVKTLRRLLPKMRNVSVLASKGIWEKKSFLNIPPHSQLIHHYDAEVYAPKASYCLWFTADFKGR